MFPNFMIAAEVLFTAPRWRDTNALSKAQKRCLQGSIWSVETVQADCRTRKSKSAQTILLLLVSFAVALSFIIEQTSLTDRFTGMKVPKAGTRLINLTGNLLTILITSFCLIAENGEASRPPPVPEEAAGLLPADIDSVLGNLAPGQLGELHSEPPPPPLISISEGDLKKVLGNFARPPEFDGGEAVMVNALDDQGNPIIDALAPEFIPPTPPLLDGSVLLIGVVYAVQEYVQYVLAAYLEAHVIRAMMLVKLPVAAALNVFGARRPHPVTQWMLLLATSFVLVSMAVTQLCRLERIAPKLLFLLNVELLVGGIVLSYLYQVKLPLLSASFGLQFLRVLLAVSAGNVGCALFEWATTDGWLAPHAPDGTAALLMLSNMVRTYASWSLLQQTDTMYRAIAHAFALLLVFTMSALLHPTALADAAVAAALAAAVVAYAASKRDETKRQIVVQCELLRD